MGRPDAAGGEDVGVAGPQGIERLDNVVRHIGDHPDFAQLDPQLGAELGRRGDIDVLGAAGKDFVADHQQPGGHGIGSCCRHWSTRGFGKPEWMPPRARKVKQSRRLSPDGAPSGVTDSRAQTSGSVVLFQNRPSKTISGV